MQHRLTVDSTQRFLRRDGHPWFLFGDTAWELFHRLGAGDAEHYLHTRREQGFNTVFAVAISEFGGADVPNAEGELPLVDRDPERPNEPYWMHVDRIVETANREHLTVGLLPCWGSYWSEEGELFSTPARALAFACWIAERYRTADVIWVLGGDRNVENQRHVDVIEAFAAGIRQVVGDQQLITYHPRESSKDEVGSAPWMDFDLIQSGHHGWNPANYQLIEQARGQTPSRPVIEGEPNYENHPVMDPEWKPVPGWSFSAADARRAIYHATFAGAAGHVYGCDGIYQMSGVGEPDPITGAAHYWRDALQAPGARQVAAAARLLERLRFDEWEPRQDILVRRIGFRGGHLRAMARTDGSAAAVYAPWGRSVHLDPGQLRLQGARAFWWDPRAGSFLPGSNEVPSAGPTMLDNPFEDDGVLVITDQRLFPPLLTPETGQLLQ